MTKVALIHEQALAAAARYKSCEIELIDVLQRVDEHRIFYHHKFNSLFQYAVHALGLSEEVAYIFINVSRKAAEVPRLKEEISAGRISVSKAKTISPVLNPENQDRWLDLARTSTKRQIEREVALSSAKHAVRERASYTSQPVEESAKVLNLREPYVELKLGVPERLMLKLRHAQDLVSQSKQSHASLVETLEEMADLIIQKKDPLEKAKRQKMRGKLGAKLKVLVPGPVNAGAASSARVPLPAAARNQVYLKYQGQCSHHDESGSRCPQRRMLQIHHLVPVHEGGTNEIDNLTLLCEGHHRAQHISTMADRPLKSQGTTIGK